MSRFTVKDLPMISRHAVKRWDILDEDVKQDVGRIIKTTLRDPQANHKDKIAASRLLVQIDRLNLQHEKLYTPKVDIDITTLSDDELLAQIQRLENLEKQTETHRLLTSVDDAEFIGESLPDPEAQEEPTPAPSHRLERVPNYIKGVNA